LVEVQEVVVDSSASVVPLALVDSGLEPLAVESVWTAEVSAVTVSILVTVSTSVSETVEAYVLEDSGRETSVVSSEAGVDSDTGKVSVRVRAIEDVSWIIPVASEVTPSVVTEPCSISLLDSSI
jgi:hypothetical protein